ncbi:MAG: ABC transporter substrate-binding protein [Clostridiales bacterium]|nr:ABC transporter substrate-binding protein [Clostridiales bacterium]
MKKLVALLIALAMLLACVGALAETVTEIPRNETLYFAGQQWGTVASWNPIGVNQNNSMAIAGNEGGYRTLVWETLYMYNPLDGGLYPLLADGEYAWNEDMTELTVKIKEAAKWNDGTPVTADDVKATWDVGLYLGNSTGNGYKDFVAGIEVIDAKTLKIVSVKNAEGAPANPLKLLDFISGTPIVQGAWIESVKAAFGDDVAAIQTYTGMEDGAFVVPHSGPYTRYYDDDQKVILVRDDNYWGQDASMWGKLPVPKYIGHAMYADNPAGDAALKAGEVDVSQQFISNVQDLWLKDELPISTYYEEAPYGLCLTMPTGWYNLNLPVLQIPAVRKAIAIAVDYDAIIASAMTNQSPSFADVPRSLMNPTPGEQALYDHEAVKDLQWAGLDIEGAKAMLDEAGIVDADGDGWREYNGEKISLNAVCPQGWTDWEASMEIVAAAGEKIGIEITTLFPTADQYYTVFTSPVQTEYAIFMWSPAAASPSQPWGRVYGLMSSSFKGIENNWSGNFGQYENAEVDEILAKIPTMSDENEIKAAYTRLVEIYLTEVPSFSLMYRPSVFCTYNETVWTNFPSDDGRNIPPLDCTDGYGIAALYDLELVGE